jgi:hypothetical protein
LLWFDSAVGHGDTAPTRNPHPQPEAREFDTFHLLETVGFEGDGMRLGGRPEDFSSFGSRLHCEIEENFGSVRKR